MTTLVECWNQLDGNVVELSSWVTAKVRFVQRSMKKSAGSYIHGALNMESLGFNNVFIIRHVLR